MLCKKWFWMTLVQIAWALWPTTAAAQIKLPSELRVRLGRIAVLRAESETPVKWVNLHDDIDFIPDSGGKAVIVLGAKAGRFKIAAYTGTKDGPSDPAYCLIIVEGDAPPAPPGPTPPPAKADPVAATARIVFGRSGCTATIVSPRRADGKWDLLTAAHCTATVGSVGKATLKDGRIIDVKVTVRHTAADICWLETTSSSIAMLPFAVLASIDPAPGVPIWHNGYGVDVPGNKETGTVTSGPDSNGQLRMMLSVSSGDSGGGIFRSDNGELVATVCCTSSMARKGSVWGGCSTMAWKLRPKVGTEAPQLGDGCPQIGPDEWSAARIHPIAILAR